MTTLSHILENKIVAIIRGARPVDVMKIAEALYVGGVKCMEVTLNSPNAMEVIRELCDYYGDRLLVGAGTVLSSEEAETAIRAGAKFIISPVVDTGTIKTTKQLGAVSMPGAFTPSEILKAWSDGADIIKVFPASLGPEYIKDIRAPLPHIPLMPTGGVNLDNIRAFQKAGGVAFGIGSALVNTKEPITEESLKQLTSRARFFAEAVNESS